MALWFIACIILFHWFMSTITYFFGDPVEEKRTRDIEAKRDAERLAEILAALPEAKEAANRSMGIISPAPKTQAIRKKPKKPTWSFDSEDSDDE
jgi:Na+-transporting methylmalonyl-CoA/oxaloacetate decarboxylase gamma subunit